MCGGSEAVERRPKRMDTAHSPRLHEEELSDADNKRASRRYYFFPPLNAEEPERARR